MPTQINAMKEEMHNLLEMFEFYLMERSLGKTAAQLSEAVRDLRIIIGRMLGEGFAELSAAEEEQFCVDLAEQLALTASKVPLRDDEDGSYREYCIEQVLTAFEWVQEIKSTYADDEEVQRLLIADIPILRPFDYGLSSRFKVVHGK